MHLTITQASYRATKMTVKFKSSRKTLETGATAKNKVTGAKTQMQ